MRKIITIDGLAGSGKTSLAKALAKKTGFKFLSSGLIYRAIGYLVYQNKIDYSEVNQIVNVFDNVEIKIVNDDQSNCRVLIDNQDLTDDLYSPEISDATSACSQHIQIREKLIDYQRNAFMPEDLIAEGRDMGTVVFPEAESKFFIRCEPEILIQRRMQQILKNKPKMSPNELKELESKLKIEITERNKRDLERKNSPTVPAKDAVILDNSSKTLTELVDIVYSRIKN